MFYLNLLVYIYPEVYNLSKFEHSKIHHPEHPFVIGHIFECLNCYEGNDPYINFSILFHDIGKGQTFGINEKKGTFSYIHHDLVGRNMIRDFSDKYKFPNDLKNVMAFCAEKHMLFHNFPKMRKSKILKLMISSHWKVLYEVAKCDSFSRGKALGENDWIKVTNVLENFKNEEISPEHFKKIKSKINGDFIMKVRNIKTPSKEVGYCLEKVLDFIINKNVSLEDDIKIIKYLKGIDYKKHYYKKDK
jgi:hypothetical protein